MLSKELKYMFLGLVGVLGVDREVRCSFPAVIISVTHFITLKVSLFGAQENPL